MRSNLCQISDRWTCANIWSLMAHLAMCWIMFCPAFGICTSINYCSATDIRCGVHFFWSIDSPWTFTLTHHTNESDTHAIPSWGNLKHLKAYSDAHPNLHECSFRFIIKHSVRPLVYARTSCIKRTGPKRSENILSRGRNDHTLWDKMFVSAHSKWDSWLTRVT